MSLVGSVSLTNKEGVFLGKVNLNNFDACGNSIVFSPDGTQLKGNNLLNYDQTTNTLILNNDTIGTAGNAHISLNGDTGGVNQCLTSNGYAGLKWVPVIGSAFRPVFYDIGQQQGAISGTMITIYNTNGDRYNYLPDPGNYVECNFNLTFSAVNTVLTISMYDVNNNVLDTHLFNVNKEHLSVPLTLRYPTGGYSANFYINASVSSGTVSVDTYSYYSVLFNQLIGQTL
jgi:hypothetical protein